MIKWYDISCATLYIYNSLACKNSLSVQNELFNNIDFISFLNLLKLSSFFIFKSRHLYNLTPMCSALFWWKVKTLFMRDNEK